MGKQAPHLWDPLRIYKLTEPIIQQAPAPATATNKKKLLKKILFHLTVLINLTFLGQ